MKQLSEVKRGKSICLYGAAGVGKTRLLHTIPIEQLPCLVFDTEGKINPLAEALAGSLALEKFQLADYSSKNPGSIIDAVEALQKDNLGFKTIIVDSLSSWENHLLWSETKKSGKAFPGWDQRNAVAMKLRMFLQQYVGELSMKGINFICTAVYTLVKKSADESEIAPDLGGHVPLEMPALFCDVIYMDIDPKSGDRYFLTERCVHNGVVHNARHEKYGLSKLINKPGLDMLW